MLLFNKRLVTACLVPAIAVSSCIASPPEDANVVTPSTLTPVAGLSPTPFADPGSVSNQGQPDKVLTVAVREYLVPDPHHAAAKASLLLGAEVYSGLMRFQDDNETTNVVPDLAASYSVSEDARTYTFSLRQGIRFSNGAPVVAADFKWSWERALTEGTSDRIKHALGSIVGAPEVLRGESQDLVGVRAVDDRTLQITLIEPRRDFLMCLADPVSVVLSKENVTQWGADFSALGSFDPTDSPFDFEVMPAGTGPFQFSHVDFLGRRTELVRNDAFSHSLPWLDGLTFVESGPTGQGERTAINVVEVDVGTQLTADWRALESGEIHVFESEIDPRPYSANGYSEDWLIKEFASGFRSNYIILNDAVPPFDDEAIRASLRSAFDPAYLAGLYDSPVADGIAPASIGGRLAGSEASGDPSDHELIADVPALPAETRIVVPFDRTSDTEPIAFSPVWEVWEVLLGVDVELNGMTTGAFNQAIRDGTLPIRAIEVEAMYPDRGQLYAPLKSVFGRSNTSDAFESVQELLLASEIELDVASRNAALRQVDDNLADRMLLIPVAWDVGRTYVVTPSWVGGLNRPRYHGSRFADVYFASGP